MRPWLLVFPVLLSLIPACQRPEPPVITPRSAKVTSVSATGLELMADLEAENPNGIPISARSVTAKVKLDGRYDVGTIKVATPLELPAHKKAHLQVPLTFRWSDMTGLGALAVSNRAVPYEVDGTVEIGGESLSVNVPFRLTGSITHEQLVQAAIGSLPRIPGLFPPK